jgi:hypothetical protein
MKQQKPRFPGQIGDTKVNVIPKMYDWGVYYWRLPNGRKFSDGSGNFLTIASDKGDLAKIQQLQDTAAHHGRPDGTAVFEAGARKITDEEHSEQIDRLKQGMIPSLNDLGAIHAAQQTFRAYGDND